MLRQLFERLGLLTKRSWVERHVIVILIFASLLFMAISLGIGLQQSVWFDESYSILLAKQSVGQLLHLTAQDTHPPVYYLLLKAWAGLFGLSEAALRSFTVLAAGGAVFIGGLLVKRMFGAKAALMSLPFIVFSPLLLRYGFEIRMYSLASLIGVTATYVLVMALETKDRQKQRWLYIVYAALVALGMFTLYYTALLWITHLVWLVWLARYTKQPILKQPWVLAFTFSGLLFLPWLPTFIRQLTSGALAPIAQALTLENLTGIVSFIFLYQPSWQVSAPLALVVVFVIVALAYFATRAFQKTPPKQKPYLLLLGLYSGVPIAIIALVSLIRPLYVERYLAQVTIGISLFIGVIVYLNLQKASKKMWGVAGALLIVMLIGVGHLAQVGNYNFQRLQPPMTKQAAMAVGECRKDKTVFVAEPYLAIELDYYLSACTVRFYNQWPTLQYGYAPLAGSTLQVKDPVHELAHEQQLTYIYYEGQRVDMPPNLKQSSDRAFGPLHVVKLSAE